MMFGEAERLIKGRRRRREERAVSRGREKEWTTCINNGIKAFGIFGG